MVLACHGHPKAPRRWTPGGPAAAPGCSPAPWLVHADLHNHTRLSDGAGDPGHTFASLRAAGLDVAAITDHSRWASAFLGLVGAPGWTGIDGRAWRQTASLADAANRDGGFAPYAGLSGRTSCTAT